MKSVDYRTPPDAVAQAARHAARLCAALLVLGAGVLLLSPTFRVRITAPDVADWYRADYSVTRLPGLAPNELIATPVTIRNRGLVTWRSAGLRPVALSYHWLDPRTRRVVRYNGRRTLLPQPVDPGGALLLSADVQAPDKPGDYLLAWDMVVEHSGWFSERGTPMAEVAVAVAGRAVASQPAPGAEPANMPREIVVRPPPPPRSQLWGAAVRMWSARPLLGIGPDVFRHAYGPELGLRIWDDRLHTNSLYLELLVGAGVAGLAAFLLLVGLALWRAARVLVSAGRKAALRTMDDGRTTNDERPFDPAVPERVEGQGGRTTTEPNIGRFHYADGFHHQGTKAQRTEKLGVLVSWWLGTLSLHMPLCTGAATRHGRLADDDLPAWMALGCGVALLAFLFHGVLDMFLEYSATSVLLWALIGALGSLTAIGSVSDDRPEHI